MDTRVRFNTDLLQHEDDRAAAKVQFPNLVFALDDPDLRALFWTFEVEANAAKSRSRRWGALAVILVTIALIAAALEPTAHEALGVNANALRPFAWVAAACGVVGVVIGLTGIMFGDAKTHWLERRYLAERLRQLHFQTLIRRAPEIVAAAASGDPNIYIAWRRARLERFRIMHVNTVAAKLGAIIAGRAEEDVWLIEPPAHADAPDSALMAALLEAIEQLRLQHQIDFAELKLRDDDRPLTTSPVELARVISGLSLACVIAVLGIDLVILGGIGWLTPLAKAALGAAALCLAIVALAARTLEDGFQPQREVERYRHYAAAALVLRERFRAATDPKEKLGALGDLEVLAYEEMVAFLKSNHEARFVM